MAPRVNEDERNERIIRGLSKLPGNRRCINCNILGPQYVCTNFCTFVCITCSGIHREFTHRVKSISMAKFTSQEVSALQVGGNERAKEVYFKEWDSRLSVPDSSDIERLRAFIRRVYVDRRYTGERSTDRPPRFKMVDKEDSYYTERSRPGGRKKERNSNYNYDERLSDLESQKYGDSWGSPSRFEVVDDRIQDDRCGNRKSKDNWFYDGEPKPEGRSPNYQKAVDTSRPQVARPVRDILGDQFPTLRVGEPPKANGLSVSDGSDHTQRTVSLRSTGAIEGKLMVLRGSNSESFTFFNSDLEPTLQTQEASMSNDRSIREPKNSSIIRNKWATFARYTPEKVSQASSHAKTTDSVLQRFSVTELTAATALGSTPVLPVNGGVLNGDINNMPMLPVGSVCVSAPLSNLSFPLPCGSSAPAAAPLGSASSLPISLENSLIEVSDAGECLSTQPPQCSSFPDSGSHSTPRQFTPSGSNNQSWSTSLNSQGFLSFPTLQSSQSIPKKTHETSPAIVLQSLPLEDKSGSKELPEDLFTATYSSLPAQLPGWQAVQHLGMEHGMQYPFVASQHELAFPQPSKSTNPFELNNELTPVHVPMFLSMASLQGALPNATAPPGLLRSSSFGAPPPRWMTPWSAMPPQPVSYISGMPPSANMGQQISSNLPPLGSQEVGAFGSDGAFFGTLNTSQQLGATHSSFSSTGRNPFG